ncbi:MAG: hypothetical protein U0800_14615 [Isosphaeraceae bacterium]
MGLVLVMFLAWAGWPPDDLDRPGLVIEDGAEVLDAPDPGALPTGKLHRGERITVRHRDIAGWLAIVPPPGSLSWVEDRGLRDLGDGRCRVEADQAIVRSGRLGARLPGTVQATLPLGSIVRKVEKPPLVLGEGESRRTWLAIEPVENECRYVLASAVDVIEPGSPRSPSTRQDAGPGGSRDELAQVEARHRVAVSGPVDQWRLGPIRRAYEELQDRLEDPKARDRVADRLSQVALQIEVARAAAEFQARLRASRARDEDLARLRREVYGPGGAEGRAHAAEGWLQASSETYEGRRLLALIGRDGVLSALLRLPPTMSTAGLSGNRVGVVGEIRYLEALPVRLIEVRDIDLLGKAP